jgi:hypothetical protein
MALVWHLLLTARKMIGMRLPLIGKEGYHSAVIRVRMDRKFVNAVAYRHLVKWLLLSRERCNHKLEQLSVANLYLERRGGITMMTILTDVN